MNVLNLFYSFRVRLLFLLAALLVSTLGVQFYLDLREQWKRADIIAEQERAVTAALALAVDSISSVEYLENLRQRYDTPFLSEAMKSIKNILIVNDQNQIEDSLDSQYLPRQRDDGTTQYVQLSDVPLPPIVEAESPAAPQPGAGESRAFRIKAETSKGRKYIVVVVAAPMMSGSEMLWSPLRTLAPTLFIMLAAILLAGILVWRFTQPITDLSQAAQRVAAGDFDFRVPAALRRDEMGALAAGFDEMVMRLGSMRELEARLNQAERSAVVGRLASAIAHEIRNPLNYINLTLDHLRTALAPEDTQKRAIFERLAVQLKVEVARINRRISEFLNYSRPAKLDLQPLDLRALLEDSLRLVEVQAAENGITTEITQRGVIPTVEADAESLRSVFTNLIINGLQAIDGKEGRITIELSTDNGHVLTKVSDTGRGVSPEHLPQLFEPYFSTKETGTGLGLAIVEKAVEDHGGRVAVESQLGAGTTFTVTLPAKHHTRAEEN